MGRDSARWSVPAVPRESVVGRRGPPRLRMNRQIAVAAVAAAAVAIARAPTQIGQGTSQPRHELRARSNCFAVWTRVWRAPSLVTMVVATTIIAEHQSKLIHYVPEHTCTVRVQLILADNITAQQKAVTLFGKAYYNDEGAETFRLMQHLWHSPICQNGDLRIARPLAYDPATRQLWQEGLPDARCSPTISEHPNLTPCLPRLHARSRGFIRQNYPVDAGPNSVNGPI